METRLKTTYCVPIALQVFYVFVVFSLVICHMEGSGKWPSDRLAIRHIKAAFHIRLGELLKQEHGYTCRPLPTHLDVWKVTCVLHCISISIITLYFCIIFVITLYMHYKILH